MKIFLKQKTFNIKSIEIIILNNHKIYINKEYINKFVNFNKNFKKNKINILIKKTYIPIYIIHINKNIKINNKINNINIEIYKNNNLLIIEEYLLTNKFINYNYNIIINKNTKLNYINIINLKKKSNLKLNKKIFIKRKCKYNELTVSINSKKILINNIINLYKYSYIDINNISLIKKKNYFYYKTHIIHNNSNSISYQQHKNIILSSGIIKFSSIITILKKSYNTLIYLINKNLCFNNPNIIYAKPQLNILNKNTKCKHKVLINTTDKNIIFYLYSRGLNKYIIKKILYLIFIDDSINKINNKYINNKLYKIIFKKI